MTNYFGRERLLQRGPLHQKGDLRLFQKKMYIMLDNFIYQS